MQSLQPSFNASVVLADMRWFRLLSKQQAEFVITRYDEPLDWVLGGPLENLATIYNKGPESLTTTARCMNVPNHGLGLETNLRHIIENYDSLADTTMFCQGRMLDRKDQPLYPLRLYFDGATPKDVRGLTTSYADPPNSRFLTRLPGPHCRAIGERTLAEFRDHVVGIPYEPSKQVFVRGDWIAAGRDAIRSRPLEYYKQLYEACKFERGVVVEECWYLERSLYLIFTGAASQAS